MPPEPLAFDDLVGAFGDIIWAAHVNRFSGGEGPQVEVLALADDQEFLLQRLLLSGYEQDGEGGLEPSLWRRPAGGHLKLLDGSASWTGEALMAATRNRDRLGAPHVTSPFVILERLLRPNADPEELLGLIRDAGDRLAEVEETIDRCAPERGDALRALIEQAGLRR